MFDYWDEPVPTYFNSQTSADFLDYYKDHLKGQIEEDEKRPSHKTFAPSSFRCDRISWFRLKGVEPDKNPIADTGLDFTAKIGTACHINIQKNLIKWMKDDWISVSEYLKEKNPPFNYNVDSDGIETQITIEKPPVRFACDGLLRWKNKYYLLEIKTSEYSSFQGLSAPKPQHIDQIKFYCTLLDLDNVLFLYQDRMYGDVKVFEQHVTELDKQNVKDKIENVMKYVDYNLCPPKLPEGDKWCTSSMCKYYNKCKQY